MCHLKQTLFGSSSTCESAFFVAEQLSLQKLSRQSRAIEIDKCFICSRAVFVEPSRQNAFAAARLAADQYWTFTAQDFSCLIGESFVGGVGPDEGMDSERTFGVFAGKLFVWVAFFLKWSLKNPLKRGK